MILMTQTSVRKVQRNGNKGMVHAWASIAMGNADGVARAASLTVVRSDIFSSQQKKDGAVEIWIDGLAKTYDDIEGKKVGSQNVVRMSIGVNTNADEDYEACYVATMTSLLQALDERDGPITATPGNDGTEIAVYPALLKKPLKSGEVRLKNLVIVGGFLVRSGDYDNDIRDPEIEIYGPADDTRNGPLRQPGLVCASRVGKK